LFLIGERKSNKRFFERNIHTKRRASSRTRPAVSTHIKTFPSRRIVSKIVAIKRIDIPWKFML
jgi:hypothetical protein